MPSAPFAQALTGLLGAARGLPLVGWEAACRLSPTGLTCNRLLFGFETAMVAPARLQGLTQALDMPPEWVPSLAQELPQARRILLAAEHAGPAWQGAERKAYVEFHGPDHLAADDLPSGLAMRGRKWRSAAPDAAQRVTDYWRTGVQAADLVPWLRQRQVSAAALGPATELLGTVLALVQAQANASVAPDCLVVTESPSTRLSCCVRLYDSGLRLAALQAGLQRLAQAWHLPLTELAQLPVRRRLGWLAAGIDAGGQPFLTVYAESSLADARYAITLGAFDEKH